MAETELSNVDITVYALSRLRGHERKVHTEEIAVEAFQLAKERFGWKLREFREKGFPDKEVARIALMDAAKEKYGALVEGRSGVEARGKDTDGWMLTPAGSAWVRDNFSRLEQGLGTSRPNMSKAEADRFRKRITSQPLFQKYLQKTDLAGESPYALTDMLNTSPDAPKEVIAAKFLRVQATAALIGDPTIAGFLDACARAFPNLLSVIRH
jgi:hypothetical protein